MKTVSELRKLLDNGELTAVDLANQVLALVQEKNTELHALLGVYGDVLDQAVTADARLAAGERTPLLGIPIVLKDNILVTGEIASAGSQMLANYVATYDAHVVSELRRQGAILIGRANMDEFAMGSSTENSSYGPTKNPLDTTRVPGGSSGGSAAAVAAGIVPVSLGSDTGGSVRQPAAFCGLVGLHCTYGSVSRYGLIALASSLDQIGPFGKTVDDVEIVFNAISTPDVHDATNVPLSGRTPIRVRTKKIGVPKQMRPGGELYPNDTAVVAAYESAIKTFTDHGYEIVEVDLPHLHLALPVYYVILPAEASTNLARFDGIRYGLREHGKKLLDTYIDSRTAGIGAEPQRRILLGAFVLSSGYRDAYYGKAVQMCAQITSELLAELADVDAIVMPTTSSGAFEIGDIQDPVTMYLQDLYTVGANLAGVPALAIPWGQDKNNMPLGVQLIGNRWDEKTLFDVGRVLEATLR